MGPALSAREHRHALVDRRSAYSAEGGAVESSGGQDAYSGNGAAVREEFQRESHRVSQAIARTATGANRAGYDELRYGKADTSRGIQAGRRYLRQAGDQIIRAGTFERRSRAPERGARVFP